jgi:hypothetical protein
MQDMSGQVLSLNLFQNMIVLVHIFAEEITSEELSINSYNSLEVGLYAYYSFDQTSGTTLIDDTGNGNTGSMSLTNPFSVDVPTELSSISTGSFYFDNTDDRVIMDTVLYQYPMTISTWVKPESSPGAMSICIWGSEVDTGDGFGAQNEANFGYGYIGGSSVPAAQMFMRVGGQSTSLYTGGLTQSVWQHVTYIISENTMKVFVDGVEIGNTSFASGFSADFSGYQYMRLGTPGASIRECHAYLDDLRFYSRELSLVEIQRLANGQTLCNNKASHYSKSFLLSPLLVS